MNFIEFKPGQLINLEKLTKIKKYLYKNETKEVHCIALYVGLNQELSIREYDNEEERDKQFNCLRKATQAYPMIGIEGK